MKTVAHYLKLVRWFHELVAIVPFLSLYLVIFFFANQAEVEMNTTFADFMTLCFCVQLLIAAGCVLNDIMDERIDAINKPHTHIINRVISLKNAWKTFWLLTLAILLLTSYITISFFSDWWWIAGIVYALSISYDTYFKRSPLLGNILIATITAFIPLVVLFYCSDVIEQLDNPKIELLIYLFSAYSFLIIVPRELSLDISDLEGDLADNCKTLPILIGAQKAKHVVIGMIVLNALLAVVFAIIYPHLSITMCIIAIGHLYYIRLFLRSTKRIDYIRAGRFLWFIFIIGMIGFTVSTLV